MEDLQKYILEQFAEKRIDRSVTKELLQRLDYSSASPSNYHDIAIIGMSGRFPDAENLNEFWTNLVNGKNCIGRISEQRWNDIKHLPEAASSANYSKLGGFLRQIDQFNAESFRISDAEAVAMDPYQRIFLETAWGAIEDAGFLPEDIYGTRTGLFVGRDHTNHSVYESLLGKKSLEAEAGCWSGILASRVSFVFNFRGPAIVVDTACSSALAALYLACKELREGKIDMAIVGGVSLDYYPGKSGGTIESFVENLSGVVRTFDKHANGTIWGEGAGAVLLKPLKKALEDKDNIQAVIKGIAMNNDGQSNGILAPNSEAQKEVILNAWRDSGIHPESLSYIEAHGTGTKLGDPIEVKGLASAFGQFTQKKQFCSIGSLKGNIGHVQAASGMASLLKVVLSLKNRTLPASINFKEPNNYIKLYDSPVYINDKTREWKYDGLLTAGINSFGFTGTNCHAVVQEAPREDSINENRHDLNVFTLSAPTVQDLRETLQIYDKYLSGKDCDLQDICYTINTGRIHHQHRIAIIVQGYADLRSKINKMLNVGFDTHRGEGIYYNFVSNIWESDDSVLRSIRSFQRTGDLHDLIDVCESYISGTRIPWSELYKDSKARKVTVPGNRVLKKRYWPNEAARKPENGSVGIHLGHPLLERLLVETNGYAIYSTLFDAKNWVLSEHMLLGVLAIPSSTYTEIALELAYRHFQQRRARIDIEFLKPLTINDSDRIREAHVVVKCDDQKLEFTISSKSGKSGKWSEHAKGIVYKEIESEPVYCSMDFQKGNRIEEAESISLNDEIFEYGPRWNCTKRTLHWNGAMITELELPDRYAGDLTRFYLHPALLDVAVNTVARLSDSFGGVYVPLSYRSMEIYGPTPSRFYSRIEKLEADNAKDLVYSIELFDENGRVFAKIGKYRLKWVVNTQTVVDQESKTDSIFFRTVWREFPFPIEPLPDSIGDEILLFADDGAGESLAEFMRRDGYKIVEIRKGESYRQIGEDVYSLAADESDFTELFKSLGARKMKTILYLWSLNDCSANPDLSTVDVQLENNVFIPHVLMKELAKQSQLQSTNIVLVTRNANTVIGNEGDVNPFGACIQGIGKVIVQENIKLKVRCIDVDRNTDISQLYREICFANSPYTVAIRDGRRYVQELEPSDLDALPLDTVTIKSDGVYVITGGTGGIGLEVAKYFSLKNKVTIALINRSVFPERSTWDEILEKSENARLCSQIQSIRSIEESGSSVHTFSADIADLDMMRRIFEQLRSQHGTIRGIVHSAGIAGDGLFVRKNAEKIMKVLVPKIQGTLVIEEATKEDDLDFYILCSSAIGTFGLAGSADYTAANSFLNAFSEYRNLTGKRTLSIGWPAWSEVGMAVNYGVDVHDDWLFDAISTERAIESLDRIIHYRSNHMIVGSMNIKEMLKKASVIPVGLSEQLRRTMTVSDGDEHKDRARIQNKTYATPQNEMEKRIHDIWINALGQDLGMNMIGVTDSYFEIGGNSVLLLKLEAEMERHGFSVDGSEIYQHSTIRKLSNHLLERGV
ncbi:SDR family NAD(P)-dependent oxidoreductase [Paenibacillus glucanolyticus]|uniref:SDR family NAD(P)-dependent oxidoreductase n=1 Tax=Paenibacillus glucanolyticus TaxID=59843 RepID=UPI003689A3E1